MTGAEVISGLGKNEHRRAHGIAHVRGSEVIVLVTHILKAHDDICLPEGGTLHALIYSSHMHHEVVHPIHMYALAYGIVIAPRLAGKLLAHHGRVHFVECMSGIALEHRDGEHAEEGAVGKGHFGLQHLVGHTHFARGIYHTAGHLHLRKGFLDGALGEPVASLRSISMLVLTFVRTHRVDTVGFVDDLIDAILLPSVQHDEDDEHQTHREAHHIDQCVELVA